MGNQTETIETAAIRANGTIFSLPRPGRHCDVFKDMRENHGIENVLGPDNQGFVTSTGRFVGRQEAMRIAKAAKQIERGKFQPDTLFSEDLW